MADNTNNENENEENDEQEPRDDTDDDEIIAEIEEVLVDMVDSGSLELASSRRGATFISGPLFTALDRDPEMSIADWLVEQVTVSELYIDEEEIREKLARVFARIGGQKAPVKHNDALAAAVLANPDDVQAWAVYGDWLSEQGDPRGELVAIHLAKNAEACAANDAKAKNEKETMKRFKEKEEALQAKHRRHFYGELWGADGDGLLEGVTIKFGYGYFDDVEILPGEEGYYTDADATLGTLLNLESARFLRRLLVRAFDLAPIQALLTSPAAQTTKGLPSTLESLELRGDAATALRGGAFDVGQVVHDLERLTELTIVGNVVTVSALENLPKLETLTIKAVGEIRLHKKAMDAPLPSLERLVLDGGLDGRLAIAAFFAKPPPKLTALAIRNSRSQTIARAIVKGLLGAPELARNLRELDLRTCALFDASIAELLEAREMFPKLTLLDLRGNDITSSVQTRVEAVWKEAFTRPGNVRDDFDDRFDDGDE